MSTKHAFPGKTVNAVIVIKIVSINFSDNIGELSKARTNWTPEYAASHGKNVDSVSETYLGVNTRNELFSATATLSKLTIPVKDDLSTIKKNISIDFKTDEMKRKDILSKLGYPSGHSVSQLNQSELVALLTAFKRALVPALLTEITAKGLPAEIPNRVLAAVAPITEANAVQEKLKTSTKEATDTTIKELNKLYEETISICKIAADHFKKDPVKKEKFTFSRLMHNLGEARPATKVKATTENTTT
jgi:hypothetical protein